MSPPVRAGESLVSVHLLFREESSEVERAATQSASQRTIAVSSYCHTGWRATPSSSLTGRSLFTKKVLRHKYDQMGRCQEKICPEGHVHEGPNRTSDGDLPGSPPPGSRVACLAHPPTFSLNDGRRLRSLECRTNRPRQWKIAFGFSNEPSNRHALRGVESW